MDLIVSYDVPIPSLNLYNNTNGDWFDMAECCLIKTSNPGIPDMEKPRVKGEFRYALFCIV